MGKQKYHENYENSISQGNMGNTRGVSIFLYEKSDEKKDMVLEKVA